MRPNPELYLPDQLVVDLPGLRRIETELQELLVGYEVERHEKLGLALLSGLSDAAGGPIPDLDALLSELRRRFGSRAPEMEQNWSASAIGTPLSMGPKPMSIPSPASHPLGMDIVPLLTPGTIGSLGPKPMSGHDPEPVGVAQLPDPPGPGTGKDVHIGILDGPLAWHSVFEGKSITAGTQFWPGGGPVAPRTGHATFVTSLILARAPEAQLDVVSVLDGTTGRAAAWDTAKQMMLLADAGVQILNLSLGTYTADDKAPLVLRRAVERINERVLVVAAAGNHGNQRGWRNGRTKDSSTWPAALEDVVAVGATDENGVQAEFSPDQPWVDCEVVGVNVIGAYLRATAELSTGPQEFGGYAMWSGTSFATAAVTGLIAAHMTPGTTAGKALEKLGLGQKDGSQAVRL